MLTIILETVVNATIPLKTIYTDCFDHNYYYK